MRVVKSGRTVARIATPRLLKVKPDKALLTYPIGELLCDFDFLVTDFGRGLHEQAIRRQGKGVTPDLSARALRTVLEAWLKDSTYQRELLENLRSNGK